MTVSHESTERTTEIRPDDSGAPKDRVWRYDCKVNAHNIEPKSVTEKPVPYPLERYEQWTQALDASDDKLGTLAQWIEATIKQIPAGKDKPWDVDAEGSTQMYHGHKKASFTQWVEPTEGTFLRFSESRTAMHPGGALRTPVMHGVVLEATSNPNSLDPRDAVSLAIFEYPVKAGYYHYDDEAIPGKLYDMTEFTDKPYTAGPLYSGHPNEVKDPDDIQRTLSAAVATLELTIDSHNARN
jgi:hypothetical protein